MSIKSGPNTGDFTPAQLLKIKVLIDEATKPLSDKINILTTRIADLENEKNVLKHKLDNNIITPQSSAAIWSSFATKSKTPEQCDFLNVLANEQKERQMNEKRAIIYGIKISDKNDVDGKKQDDLNEINSVFEKLNIDKTNIKSFLRLKTKNDQQNKPSPIIIELKSSEQRNKLVISSNKVRLPNIFINRDLTESERHEAKKKRDEIKRLNSTLNSGESFYFGIRNNRIYKIDSLTKKVIGRPESS